MSNDGIYVAMSDSDFIIHYNITGTKRSVRTRPVSVFWPSMCGINQDNQLLVTNRRTNAVEWINVDGTSNKVIHGLRGVPVFALYIDKSKVLVLTDIGDAKSCLNINNHNLN